MLNLKPVLTKEFSCFDNVLIHVVNWYGKGYIYMFAESLPFSYNKSGNKIGNNIILDPISKFYLMKEYYGVNSFYHERHMSDKALDTIKAEIDSNNPVMIGFDTYWMPWDPVYLKLHFIYHYCIAIGYDDNNIYFFDPSKGLEESIPLSIEYFLNGVGHYITFSKVEGFNSEKITWPLVLKGTLKSLKQNQNGHNFQKSLELLAKDIEMNLDIQLEFKGQTTATAWQAAIVQKVWLIKWYRVAFCSILGFICDTWHKGEDIVSLLNEYKKLVSIWGIINSLLYRGFLENDSSVKDSIVNNIEETMNYEIGTIDKLAKIIDKY